MIVGIIGSRRRNSKNDYHLTRDAFVGVVEWCGSLVSGGCPKGGDKFSEILSKQMDIPIRIYEAEWHRYGKSAGFIRNTYIAEDADILIACVAKDRKGGTEDTIKKFLEKIKMTEQEAIDSKLLILV